MEFIRSEKLPQNQLFNKKFFLGFGMGSQIIKMERFAFALQKNIRTKHSGSEKLRILFKQFKMATTFRFYNLTIFILK